MVGRGEEEEGWLSKGPSSVPISAHLPHLVAIATLLLGRLDFALAY